MKRNLESNKNRAKAKTDSDPDSGTHKQRKSVAVLYFENLSGSKEDEYLRDGITEDVITELSKIRGLNVFSRPTVLAFRDQAVTPQQVGQKLGAACVLTGTLRRSGARLRISAQLVDAQTDFPLWSERFDREMKDVFEVQDEMARKIAEALRVTLSPEELEAMAVKPTENLQAYDLYLRGKSYARRQTRQDLEFALQMFENGVAHRPQFRAGLCRLCQRLRDALLLQPRSEVAGARARSFRQGRSPALGPARSAGEPGVGALCGRTVRRSRAHGEEGHRAQARLRGSVLPAVPRAVCGRTLPGSAGHGGSRHRGQRRGLQRLRAHHELPGRTGQDRRRAQHDPAP